MTPKDILSSRFDKAVFGGYDAGEVEDFRTQAAESLEAALNESAALARDKETLQGELRRLAEHNKILAAAVKQYRFIEKEMHEVLAEAKHRSIAIMSDADATAEERIRRAQEQEAELIESAREKLTRAEKTRKLVIDKTGMLIGGIFATIDNLTENLGHVQTLIEESNDDMPDTSFLYESVPVPALEESEPEEYTDAPEEPEDLPQPEPRAARRSRKPAPEPVEEAPEEEFDEPGESFRYFGNVPDAEEPEPRTAAPRPVSRSDEQGDPEEFSFVDADVFDELRQENGDTSDDDGYREDDLYNQPNEMFSDLEDAFGKNTGPIGRKRK
ncbi:MAG: DivIVA domain-containing protein [Oscillospiraceae bacterium]|jgi:DivIVA domain-containing protein|nr:DivIVA domain-containing protein [Oscillospiraceae bacterium]